MSKQQIPKTLRTLSTSHALHTSHAPLFARHSTLRMLFFRAHSSLRTLFFTHALLTSHDLFLARAPHFARSFFPVPKQTFHCRNYSSERCLKCAQFRPQLVSAQLNSITTHKRFSCSCELNLRWQAPL